MSLSLRLVLIFFSALTLFFVLYRLSRERMKIEDSIYWLIFLFVTAVLAIFPRLASIVSEWVGVESPANLIFLCFIFLAFIKLFTLTAKVARLERKVFDLTYRLAVSEKEKEERLCEEKRS